MVAHRSRPGATLVPASVLLGVGLVFGGLLYGLFPDRSLERLERAPVDALSLAHLRLALEARPDDPRVRLVLARQLLQLGRLVEVDAVLAPLLRTDGSEEAKALALQVARTRWLAAVGEERELRRRHLAEQLWSTHPTDLGAAQLALELGEWHLAAQIFLALADQRPPQRSELIERAALAEESGGDPGVAAEWWSRLAEAEHDPQQAVAALRRAANLWRRSGAPKRAILALNELRRRFPDAPAPWPELLELYLAQGDLEGAARLAEEWWRAGPRSDELALRLARVYVQAGRVTEARDLYRGLSAPPPDADELLWAQLEEWSGAPSEALALWYRRWRRGGRVEDRAQVERLAQATWADPILLEVWEQRLRRGDPSRALLAEWVRRAEALGQPERALALLDALAPAHRERAFLLAERARIFIELGRVREGLEVGAEACALGACSRATELERARQAARIGELELALRILQRTSPDPEDRDYWELLHGVAFALEMQVELQKALSALAALGALDGDGYARWVEVLLARGELHRALQAALEGQARRSVAEPLLLALDGLVDRQAWDLAAQLVANADPRIVGTRSYWWMLRAELDRRRGRVHDYERDLLQLAELDPSNDDAVPGVLWSRLARDDRAALEAIYPFAAARAEGHPSWSRPLGAVADRLGRAGEAAHWYGRLYQAGDRDPLFWLEYARVLEVNGQRVAAWRLRQAALQILEADRRPEQASLRLATATIVGAEQVAARAEAELIHRSPAGPEEVGAMAERYFATGREAHAERSLALAPTLAAAGLALALRQQDLVAVEGWLAAGVELPEALRAEALLAVGEEEQAVASAFLALGAASDEERAGLLSLLDEVSRRRPNRVSARFGLERIGQLDGWQGQAQAQLTRHDYGGMLLARFARFRAARDEVQLTAGLVREWSQATSQVQAGLLFDPQGDLSPQLVVAHSLRPARWLGVELALKVGEVTDDSATLRTEGLRDRIELGASVALFPGWTLGLDAAGVRYRARADGTLGQGLLYSLGLSRQLWATGPGLTVRATGSGGVLSVEPAAGGELQPLFGTVALGARLGAGALDGPRFAGGWSYHLDLSAGWLWPGNAPVFQAEASLGRALFGGDALALLARGGNALAFEHSLRASVELSYTYRFWP